jgi:hypothetical protein
MAALYPFFIYYDSRLIAESFLTFSLLVYIFLFVLWKESPGNLLCAGAWGLSSAVVCLAKTTFIPLTAFCLLIETLMAFGNKANRRQYLSIIGAGLIFAAPITAWGLRNQKTLGRFLLDSHGGITFVHCTVFYDVYKQGTFSEVFKNHPIHQAAKTMGEAQCDAYYFQVARDFIRTHPHEFARQIFNKIVDFWRFYPRQDINFPEGTRTITLISLLTEPFLLCCGAYGLWKTRHQWRALYPLYTAILLLTAVHGISCAQMRYRLPLMPFAILFSAVAIS